MDAANWPGGGVDDYLDQVGFDPVVYHKLLSLLYHDHNMALVAMIVASYQ